MRRTRAERYRAHRAGGWAEWVATLYLTFKGYRILKRRYVVKGGEIDIIAQKGDALAFVEVKLRSSLERASIAIDPAKRRRMSRAARVFLSGKQSATCMTLRADAIYLVPWHWPRHVQAAFQLDV